MSRLPVQLAQHPVPSGNVDAPFYVAGDVAGDVETRYANAGTVTISAQAARQRQLEENVPWSGGPRPLLRKLTHFRAPGMGDAMWSGQCVYDMAGFDPAVSYYDDVDTVAKDAGLNREIRSGEYSERELMPAQELSSTRRSRVAAVHDTSPAAAFFQGFANLHWSGQMAGFRPQIQPRPLHMNFNPGQQGTKELNKATQYQPVPPMGSIVGYFGSSQKAL